ncbi:PREDICTED: protein disulfide-isomerase A2 isoform X2 [Myotis brandtii]|uniref:protein disulfide-isomerase A2 isoform X2 n=1 Tax=Myotis brandtii TaxID=109478 RepID=UPI0003BB7DB2|nr:PREDICTED: protein disulfide-isomerase A2 isoform X2 [Myotis brandtii]
MDGQLLSVLLLLLLGALSLRGQGPGPGGPSEEPGKEEVPEEDGILVLSHRTLGRALQEHPALLVEFYAPWCGHCKALAPEYIKAAALLAAESAKTRLAKVDGPSEPELTKEFAVTEYPTLKFFRDGNRTDPEEYTGPREAEGIAEWLRRRVGSSTTRLEDEEGAQALIDAHDVVVIGFFQDLQDEDVATFLALAQDALDMTFGLTDHPQLFQKFGLTKDTVVLFKKHAPGHGVQQPGELGCRYRNGHWVEWEGDHRASSHEPCLPLQTSPKIFAARILNHLLLFINQTLAPHQELLAGFREAAPPFRGQVLFVVVDVSANNNHVLQYFGLRAEEAPTLRFINMETTKKYKPADRGPVTAAWVTTFCHSVLSGKVKPYLLSQEVPPDWDQHPVKTLVGKNFEQVAFDETKNVFIKFYAPWCTHCKEMAPTWEALAEKYRDHEDIIIAELDATANELEGFPVHGFPTLKYFPAGQGRKVIEYKSARDLETFSKFLDNGGKLPEEEPAEEPSAPFPDTLANSTVDLKEEL